MRVTGRLKINRRGQATVIGMAFFLVLFVASVGFVYTSVNRLNEYNLAVQQALESDIAQAQEELDITAAYLNGDGNLVLNMTNNGVSMVNPTRLWIVNQTDNDHQKFDFQDLYLMPGESVSNVTQVSLTSGKDYAIRVVTASGNAVSVNLVPQVRARLHLVVSNPLLEGTNTTVSLFITNNDTSRNYIYNLIPIVTAEGVTEVEGPTPASVNLLAPDQTVVFTYLFYVNSTRDTVVSFNGTFVGAPQGAFTTTSMTVGAVQYAEQSGTSSIATQLYPGSPDYDGSLYFHRWSQVDGYGMDPMDPTESGSYYEELSQDESIMFYTLNHTSAITIPEGFWDLWLYHQNSGGKTIRYLYEIVSGDGQTVYSSFPGIQDFVDINTTNVDFKAGRGSHSNFDNMKATDGTYDTLTEEGGGSGGGDWGDTTPESRRTEISDARAMGGMSPNIDGLVLKNVTFYNGGGYGNYRLAVYQGGSLSNPEGATLIHDFGTVSAGSGWVTSPNTDKPLAKNEVTWIAWKANDGTARMYYDTSWDSSSDFQSGRGRWSSSGESSNEYDPWDSTFASGGSFGNYWYSCYLNYDIDPDYKLDLEVQFVSVTNYQDVEKLCIKTGALGDEDLNVNFWNIGTSSWESITSDLTAGGWNNYTVSLQDSSFTVQFEGGTETSDSSQDQWQIDAVLLQNIAGSTFDSDSAGSVEYDHETSDYFMEKTILAGQRLRLTLTMESSGTWRLYHDTNSYDSFLMTPVSNPMFPTHFEYDGDDYWVAIENTGTLEFWINYHTRAAWRNVDTNASYASYIVGWTDDVYSSEQTINEDYDTNVLDPGDLMSLHFEQPRTVPTRAANSGDAITPGTYLLTVHLVGYDSLGYFVTRVVFLGEITWS